MSRVHHDRDTLRSTRECPYCAEDLEQWSIRFQREDAGGQEWRDRRAERDSWGWAEAADGAREGLTRLSLCPSERCGYYVLSYRNGLAHWDRDVEAARLFRTVVSSQ